MAPYHNPPKLKINSRIKGLGVFCFSLCASTYEAIRIYRRRFQPSQYLDHPYMMVCLKVIAAESDGEAEFLSTSMKQFFLNIVRGTQNPLQPPVENMDELWSPAEKEMSSKMTSVTLMGSKDTVRNQLSRFQKLHNVDEIMAVSYIYDEDKQILSYGIFKEVVDGK
jgi:alkanesulfonate monooxygenase SsuD/methylene tetrahydromethanopterin reductase-like flavin-dependent oxidoreductase (luciferase family)